MNISIQHTTPTTDFILTVDQAFILGPDKVGGKAWNLARLARYGFHIPHTLVLPVSVYSRFLLENDLQQDVDQLGGVITLQNVQQSNIESQLFELRTKIENGKFSSSFSDSLTKELSGVNLLDVPVAIRSSATSEDSGSASFAGIHESYLNVEGLQNIERMIKKCFSSIWTTRALSYRRKMKIDDMNVQPAVIIMEFINAEAAGVAFSCDPSTGREDVLLINANYGLGESIVDGVTEPDTYLIDRNTYVLEKQIIGEKSIVTRTHSDGGTINVKATQNGLALSPAQQIDLSIIVNRVFDALGLGENHQDIEWVLYREKFYLVQARPVTALPRYTLEKFAMYQDVWSNANFRDAVPMVQTVLMRDFTKQFINRMLLKPFELIGYAIPKGLLISKHINGRSYLNAALYQFLLYDSIGVRPSDVNKMMGGHQSEISLPDKSPFTGRNGMRRILAFIQNARLTTKYTRRKDAMFSKVAEYCSAINVNNLSALNDTELFQALNKDIEEFNRFGDAYMYLSSGSGTLTIAATMLKKEFGDESEGIVNALAAGQGDITSAEQGYRLLELVEIAKKDTDARRFFVTESFTTSEWENLPARSAFRKAFINYLAEFGHRGIYEMDISRPRWNEDPSYLLSSIKSLMRAKKLDDIHPRQLQHRARALKLLRQKVGFIKRKFILKLVEQGVVGSALREAAKSYTVHLCSASRKLYLEVGKRFVRKGIISSLDDIFQCSRVEIEAVLLRNWDGKQLKTLVAERKQRQEELEKIPAADTVTDAEKIEEPINTHSQGSVFKGIAVSAGVIEAQARVIMTPLEGEKLQDGEIMVAPSTDPSWTPLFVNTAGIVLETGGYTSHGSIVSREYGIPAVVNVRGILEKIKDGDTVLVDGRNGTVTIVK